jgi:hypothetical protein
MVSRSMLESLLARVRQRAAEPRQPALVIPPLAVPRFDLGRNGVKVVTRAPVEPVEEELEEYEDELIEILDDGDVASESGPEVRSLELSVSAPSVEMRRRSSAQGARSNECVAATVSALTTPVAAPRPVVAATAQRAVVSSAAATAEPLRAEVVSRKPSAVTAVARIQGVRRDPRSAPFVELLDASLKLGS